MTIPARFPNPNTSSQLRSKMQIRIVAAFSAWFSATLHISNAASKRPAAFNAIQNRLAIFKGNKASGAISNIEVGRLTHTSIARLKRNAAAGSGEYLPPSASYARCNTAGLYGSLCCIRQRAP